MRQWPTEDADMGKIGEALRRAAQRAREQARRHGVPLVVRRQGKMVLVPPDEIEDLPPLPASSVP